MKYRIQLVVADDEGQSRRLEELAVLEKGCRRMEEIGLSLAEAKQVLRNLQEAVVRDQVERYLEGTHRCGRCGAALTTKGHHDLVYRTLFGTIRLRSPLP